MKFLQPYQIGLSNVLDPELWSPHRAGFWSRDTISLAS